MQVKLNLGIVESPLNLDQKNNSNVWVISKNAVYFYGCVYHAQVVGVKAGIVALFNTLAFSHYASSHVCIASKSFASDDEKQAYLDALNDKIECDECIECRQANECLALCSCDCCQVNFQKEQCFLYNAQPLALVSSFERVVNDDGFNSKYAVCFNLGMFYKNDHIVRDNIALVSHIIEELRLGVICFYDDEKMRFALVQCSSVERVKEIFHNHSLDKVLDLKEIDIEKVIKNS